MAISTVLARFRKPRTTGTYGARIKKTGRYIEKFSRSYCSSTDYTKLDHLSKQAPVRTLFQWSNHHEILPNSGALAHQTSPYRASGNGERVLFLDLRRCSGRCSLPSSNLQTEM